MIKITIPFNPRTKKNAKEIRFSGKPLIINGNKYFTPKQIRLINGKKYRDYEKSCLEVLKWVYKSKKIDYPVNIKAIYYRKTKHTVDITNLHSALHDILVKGNVIADDNYKIVVGTDGSRIKFDQKNPRTEIEITRIK